MYILKMHNRIYITRSELFAGKRKFTSQLLKIALHSGCLKLIVFFFTKITKKIIILAHNILFEQKRNRLCTYA